MATGGPGWGRPITRSGAKRRTAAFQTTRWAKTPSARTDRFPTPAPPRPAAAPTRAPGGIGPLVLAAGGGQMHAGPRPQARLLPADGLGPARPAMARRPAGAPASPPPAQ